MTVDFCTALVRTCILGVCLFAIGWPAYAETAAGVPIIADADTVEFLPDRKVRLLDMDAPETD